MSDTPIFDQLRRETTAWKSVRSDFDLWLMDAEFRDTLDTMKAYYPGDVHVSNQIYLPRDYPPLKTDVTLPAATRWVRTTRDQNVTLRFL